MLRGDIDTRDVMPWRWCKGGMAVVGERARAAEERAMRVLRVVVGRSSSEEFMMDILSKEEDHRK